MTDDEFKKFETKIKDFQKLNLEKSDKIDRDDDFQSSKNIFHDSSTYGLENMLPQPKPATGGRREPATGGQ